MNEVLKTDRMAAVFFAIWLVAGLFIYRDYGLSWDEEINRFGTALPEYNYIFHGEKENLLRSSEKYHGPAFELILYTMERVFHITDSRQVYLFRHLANFLLFYFSAVAFFFLAKRLFRHPVLPLIALLMYALMPRIFAESFYNSKDVGFLSVFTFSLYTLQRFINRKNFGNALLHALVTGFAIGIRITGILVPLLTLLILVVDAIVEKGEGKRIVRLVAGYLVLQFAFIVLFWPVMWMNPLHHMKEAWMQMSSFPWYGQMLYLGSLVSERDLPWHYLPVWIAVTLPVFTLLFFLCGLFGLLRTFRFQKAVYRENKFFWCAAAFVLGTLAAVIVRGAVVYDGWRHLYFIYAPIVVVAVYGMQYVLEKFRSFSRIRTIVFSAAGLNFVFLTFLLIRDHPHEHVYFNLPARAIFSPLHLNFETDYWGLSYRKGLERVLKSDTARAVHVKIANDPGIFNAALLKPEDRSRLRFHEDIRLADYYLAEYRGKRVNPDTVDLTVIGRIENSSALLLTLFKGLRSESATRELLYRNLDFEDTTVHRNIQEAVAVSGRFSNRIGEGADASDVVDYLLDTLAVGEVAEAEIACRIRTTKPHPDAVLVLSVTRNDSTVFWISDYLQNRLGAADEWIALRWNQLIPSITLPGDRVRMYVWSVDRTEMYVDDFSVRITGFKSRRAVPVL